MNAASADRNLLFGILALQMDFIDRDSLVAAMNAWVLEKSKPLGQLLLEQGRIQADEQKLIDALVEKHLAKHGNDPEKSLAALSSAGQIKQDLQQIADPDLEASLRRVPEASPDVYRTQMPSVGVTTSSGVRFQILRPHAKGGLGQVSVAEDTELHREVALKEIQPAYASDLQSRARFLLEAEITGGLEHPGIVPVYGLGHYDDGRPYYAMRFVRGDSLKEAIDRFYKEERSRSSSEAALELRKLIGRLVDVCNAIEYAHSRGVLHRDLKPGNIMLGRYGETLVVDWGLAKPLDHPETVRLSEEGSLRPTSLSASAPTVFGTAVGTPQFMSPEQAAGRLALLGPPSDVYSLGATLYCILTGKPPFDDRDIGTVLQRVQRGDFDKPRQRNPAIPKPLEAICLKAMALEPQDRYPTPSVLADELERWMADEPVQAYPESAVERAGRWLRRNRTWALAAAAALLVITGASIVSATLINQARIRESLARQEAEHQRQQAETSFALARKAVDDFFTRVSETTLLDVPGLQPLRKELLQVALAYDEEFLKQRGNDPALEAETAAAWFRAGTITGEIDSKTKALEQLEKARQIQEKLVAAQPDNAALQAALANTVNAIGGVEQAIGKLKEARTHFDLARQMREKLASAAPEDGELQRKLANSYSNLGVIERAEGALDKAVPWYAKANEVRERLVAKDGAAPLYRRDLARGWYNLGVVQREADQLEAAAESFQKAIELYAKLCDEWPLVIEYRRELGLCHKALGDLRSHTDRFQDAEECYQRAREIQQPLAHDNPVLVELAADLAGTLRGLSDLLSLKGQTDEALRYNEEAGAILRQLVRDNPHVSRFRQDWAAQQMHLGLMQLAAGDLDAAKANFQTSADAYGELATDEQRTDLQDARARALMNLGMVTAEAGDLDGALAHASRAREVCEQLASRQPEDAALQDLWAYSLGRLANIEHQRGNTDEALRLYAKAQAIHERWLEGPAATLEHRQHLAEACYMVGAIQLGTEKWSEAAAAFQRAAELYGLLLVNHPKNQDFRQLRAASLHDEGAALLQMDLLEEAAAAYRQAAEEQRQAFEAAPDVPQARETLNQFLADLSAVQREAGKIDEALAACLERKKLWPKDGDRLYEVARDVALAASSVGAGSNELSDEQKANRDKVADQAIAILREARQAGFKDWQRVESDEDLNVLRDRPDYKALLEPME